MNNKKWAGALLPALLIGAPGFASTSKLSSRINSRVIKSISVSNSDVLNSEAHSQKGYSDPFSAFSSNVDLKTKPSPGHHVQDVLSILRAEGLLESSENHSSQQSGDLEVPDYYKDFARSCAFPYSISCNAAVGCSWNDSSCEAAASNSAPTDIALTESDGDNDSVIMNSSTGTNTTIASIATTDSDDSSFTYSLVSDGASANGDCGDATSDDDNGSFGISGSNLQTSSALSSGTYNFCLQTNDGETTFQEGFTLTVNAVPTAISLDESDGSDDLSIGDSSTGTDTTIAALLTTDSDDSSFTYSLVSDGSSAFGDCGDATSDDNNGSFNISGTNLRTASSLSAGSYSICLETNDGETTYQSGVSLTITDATPPVVQSITESSADGATSVAFTVTFNEDANNVTTGDFEITNVTGDATGSIDSIATAVADTTYTVTVTPSGEGSFRLDLSASTDIVDDSGNGNGTNGSVATYTSGTAHTVSFTTASTTGAGFSTGGTPTNISPSFTFDSSDETLTITDGSHMTGSTAAAAGETTADTIVIAANQSADFTALASFSGFEALTLNDDASATMTETDHEGFTSGITAGAGTETITLSTSDGDDTITGDADIEAYTLNDVYTFTLGASGQDVTGSDAASQTINIGTFTLSATSDLDGGSGQSDVLQMATGSSIASAGSIAGFETVDVTGSVTMTEAQHDGFSSGVTASGGSDQITISSADGDASVTADADVETYVLGAGMTIIHGAVGQNITGSTSADTISTSLTVTGTLDGGSGTDTLSLGNGADVDSATVSNFENLTLADGATVAVNATQLVQFSGTITANGSETINVNNDGDVTTLATTAVESYVVGDDSTNSRTITLGSGHTSGAITANSSDDAVTFNIGTQSFAGTLTGDGTDDIVQMGNGSSIVSATLNNIENLTVDSGASVTMTEDQHDAFTGTITATGTNQITISAATDGFTANADIETYVLSVANSVTLGTSGGSLTQNITGSTGSDTLTLGAATYSGILNGGDGTDTLSVVDNTNIVGATLSNFENLTLASDATLLMAAADLADFSGTVTAPGTEQITVSGDGDISTFNSAAVETYVVNDDTSNTRTITLGSNDTGSDISATSTSDTVTFSVPGITYTGTLEGQTTNGDILLLADSANVSGGTLTDIGSLSLASGASVTLSAAQYNALNNATIVAAGTGVGGEEITISGTGDLTINSTTVETYTIEDDSSDSRTITVGSDNSNTFTASSDSDAISLNVGATTFSGSFTANTDVANTLVVDGTADIASATLSGFTNLTLDGATNDLTLTVAQLNAFSGTIAGSGTDTLTFTATGSVTGGNLSAIETFATGSGGSITITIPASDVSTKTLNVTTSASDSFTVTESTGPQTINGSAGSDTLSGGDGADTINGNAGADTINGGAGADTINGNAGNDTLNGGTGADTLSPGAGTDSMTGSDGNDTFSGSASDLTGDTITDLSEGDTVKITGVTGLTTSNVRFNGANTLQIDTDATDFSAVEVAITLSNSAGGNLNILAVSDNSGDTDITFESANDVPVFSNLDNNPAFTENGSAVVLDDNVAIADTELDALNTAAGNYSGATLTIARNGGADADDEFAASGLLGALTASGNLTYSSLVYGTVTTNGSGTLVLTFSDASNVPTTAIVASIMRAITYSNGSEAPDANVTLDWTFNDGTDNSTGTNQVLVSVTAQNDAPVLNSAASPALTAITEDAGDDDGSGADGDDDDSSNTNNAGTAVATMVTDASITDVDGSAVEAIAVITVDNTNGVWQYSTNNGVTWNNFSGTTGSSVDLSTTSRLLDGTLTGASTNKVRFVPDANYNGTATITFRAWDKSDSSSAGDTADTSTNGGTTAFSSVSDSASITVTSVNDAPSVDTNDGVTVERGSNITIGSSVLSTSDTEDAASNITYTVTAVPTVGALQLSDGSNFSSLSNNDTFTQDDIDNSRVRYVHAGAVNTSDSFSFSVADQNSSQITGRTFNITIKDTTAPTITAVSIPNSTHKVGDTVTATITVSSDSDNYTTGSGGISGTIAGYNLGSLSKTNNTTYTATFTVSDNGTDYAAASAVPVNIVLTDSSNNSTSAFTTAISQAGDAIYANLPDITLSSDLTTIAEDGGVATITASITNSLNNQWPDDIGFTLGFTGTATNTTDYTRSSSSITISAGSSSSTITITGVADDLFDAASDETVIVSFDCIQTGAATLLSGQAQTITITDAESAPTVTLSVDNATIPEDGSSSGAVTATLSNATFENVDVNLAFTGTATISDDYGAFTTTILSVTAGQTSATQGNPITAVDDTDSEGDETVIVDVDRVSGGGAFESTEQQVTVTISDDDNTAPVFSNLGGTANFTEDGSAVTLDSDATVADSENDGLNSSNGNYTGSTLTIARNGGANTDDSFSVASGSQMAVSGTNLTNSIGDKFASYASSNGTMTVTFSGDLTTPTTALVNEVIQNIAYSNSSEDPITSVQLDWSFSDSQLSSTGVSNTTTVTITPVNDAPTLDDAQSPTLTAIEEDVEDGDNSGTSVSAIVVNNSIDNIEAAQTTESIVVTNVDNSNGVWQYTTDNGASWNNFTSTTGNSVDLTSTTSARLLSSSSLDNKIRFVPDQDYNGSATLTFRAWDEASGTNGSTADVATTGGDSAFSSNTDTASISITAVNDAPTIGTNTGLTVDEGATGVLTTSLLADSDPDDTGTELTFTVTTAVTNGTLFLDADDDDTADSGEALTVNSTFTQQDLADGNIQYAHNGGETTSDSFVFSLADGGEDSASTLTDQTFNISITSVNETPVITSTEVTSATEDSAYSYTIAATDVDAGDSLTFAAPTLPSWLSFVSGTGVLSGTPTNDDVGSHSVVLTVTDSGSLSATQSFTITVANTNDAPVITSTAVTSVNEDSAYSYTLTASDVDIGDSLTMTATTLPSWLSFNSATGVLSGTPTNDEVGDHPVVFTVSDSSSATDSQSFTITVSNTNDTPVFSSTAVTSATEDSAYSYTVTATDVDAGDSLTFAAPTLPSWLSFVSGTGVLSGTPTNDDVGSHSVVLTVTDSGNLSATQSFTITVANTNDAPVITSTAVTSVNEDSAYSYTLTASDVDVGDSLTMTATTLPSWLSFNSATGVLSGTPTNDEVGDHSVALSVSDNSSATDSQSFTITVSNTNDTPVFSSTAVTSATEDSAYSYTVTATDVDAGDSLTFAAPTLPSWLSFASGTGVLSGTPTNDDVGSHSVVLTVTDSGNLSATQSFTITVANTNDAPVITSTAVTSVNEDSAYSYTLAASDVDVGDSLTMTATTLPSWLSFNSATGVLSGTPTNDEVGDHSVALSVSDNSSATDSQSFTITVSNVNDAPTIDQGDSVSVNMSEDAQPTAFSLTLSATDVENDAISWSISNGAAQGAVSVNQNGVVSYSPDANYNGPDSFSVTASDGELSDTVTVSVNVQAINDAPTISGSPNSSVAEGSRYSFTPSASDIEDDVLTFSASNLPAWLVLNTETGNISGTPDADDVGTYDNIVLSVTDSAATASLRAFSITVTNVNEAPVISGTPASLVEVDTAYSFVPDASDADGDTLSFSVENLPAWLTLDTATGAITGTPTSGDVAEYENIILTVSDGELSVSLAAFSIEVIDPNVNIAPVVEDVSATTEEDAAAEITLLGSDLNDDALSYVVVTEPENGTVVITNNIATYTPASDFNGTDSFTYQASDSILSSEPATVTVTVSPVNDAPTISGEPTTQIAIGVEYSFTPEATDIDSESLTFSIENMPSWASFDENTGTLSGVPEEGDIGSFTDINISVSDGELEASLATFEIEVIDPNVNTAPVSSDSAAETEEDTPITFTLEASDEDGDTLTYTITTEPASGTIEQDGSSVTYTPNANVGDIQDSLSFTVSDGVDTSEEATVTIDIIAVNDAPEISGTPANSVRVGMVYEFTPVATDVENDTLTFTIENQPRWAAFDGNTGTLSGTPGNSDVGTYGNITISVSDGTETVALAAFNVEVLANSQPLISGTSASAVEPGQSYSFTPVASDPDGDTLTFSIENQPDWTTFDADTGSLSGIPDSDDIGNYSNIVISVTDGIDTVSLPAFNLEVCEVCGNVAPTISGLPVTSITEGDSYLFTPSASDVNGDELTFSIVNQPVWANFDSNTGTLSGTPGIADIGTTTGIVISVTDGEFTVSLNAFSITVLEFNDAPVISGTPATSVFQNDEYRFTPTASDAEGDTLVFSISNRPAWAAFNTRTGTLRGTPVAENVGSYADIVISVNDGQNSSSLDSFSITVVARNNAPTISGTPRTAISQNVAYSFTPTASDADGDSLTFSASGLPDWLSINSATGALTGTPGTEDVGTTGSIVLSVSDGTDSASLNAFTITVTEANAVPVANDSSVSVDEDSSVSITPSVSDGDGDELSFVIVSDVQNGNLTETATGWTYTPETDFNGSDSFVYQANDGDSSSEQATISITVNSINDRPVAVADTIVLDQNDTGIYTLNVLSNDIDVDIATNGDVLTLQGVQADFGIVSVVNNQIQFEPGLSFIGDVDLQYAVRDNARRSAQARVNLTINGVAGIGQPILTVPDDLTVDAEGLFTEVDLGVAEASDADGNPLPVSLVRASNSFKPGARKVFWRTEDSFGSVTTDSQTLHVNPLISLGKDKVVNEDSTVRMRVLLNGDAPVYPLTVNYSVSGTATFGEDHNAQSGSVTFNSGREQIISFNVFADDEVESDETIIFALNSGQNLGANNTSVVTISEQNIAPEIRLMVSQSGDNRLTVAQDEGSVVINATVTDANPQDSLDTDWISSVLSNSSSSANQFLFEPSDVATGIYQVSLFASDNGDPILSNTADVFIEVVDSLAVLSEELDTDGDLIPDSQEGYADSDGDGIPDYLDAIDECNVVPEQAATQDEFLAESEPGVCMRQGAISALNSSDGLEVIVDETTGGKITLNRRGDSAAQRSDGLPEDPEATNIGGIFDFILYDLPEEGQIASIVLPQTRPVPSNAVYRKYSVRNERWTDFVINDNNQVFSARGTKGVCPPPGSSRWTVGLTEGHWCVQLRVLDGGINDDDGLVNGAIADPGGVAVVLSGNNLPDIQSDAAEMQWNTSIEIDVLANDSDVDGDTLTIESVDASFGTAEITSSDTIMYTPDSGYVGTDVLIYAVSDGNGGTGSGEVTVTINGNRAPGARSDSASTTDDMPIEIDVLANDTDVDGDPLTIDSATVDVGEVMITANNTLLYTPANGFDGLATITYVISDSFGETDSATVSVVVEGNQSPQATDDSVNTEYGTSVVISVLDNDMDVDGDTLTVVSATADSGSVVVNSDQTLTFTPATGFSGLVTISYVISDGELTDEGTVRVTVAQKPVEIVNVTNKSGGGAFNLGWLLVILLLGFYRQNYRSLQKRR